MTTKEAVQRRLNHLPDDASLDDVRYLLYVLQKIQAGEQDVQAGRLIPYEEVMPDLATWLK